LGDRKAIAIIGGMTPRMIRSSRLAAALALALPQAAPAVTLNPEGLGQALIYPYYTVRTSRGNAFNTYLSVVNHSERAKAVRVRVRESHNAREVASLNLYLSPNDVWTAAIVPTADGARLLTADRSCTDPLLDNSNGLAFLDFRNAAYSGNASDGFLEGLDRTREGYVEMIEMATLAGSSAIAVSHSSAGVPANCPAIRTGAPAVAAPTGGLSGTLTLINVNNGTDFNLNAEALADLSTQPFFRSPTDPYPDFAATEIDPVSLVIANGKGYRSTWTRGVDAVSAVLMRTTWLGEYVLDVATASLTDFVVTQPTRHHYVTPTTFQAPYSGRGASNPDCYDGSELGELLRVTYFNREETAGLAPNSCQTLCAPAGTTQRVCAAVGVATIRDPAAPQMPSDTTRSAVFGSSTGSLYRAGNVSVAASFQHGWISSAVVLDPARADGLAMSSLPSSQRIDLATGEVASGPHTFKGLPLLGFAVRTFSNGTLTCAGGACQGNYGGAFPFKYLREVAP
jgi:hypothetical protein